MSRPPIIHPKLMDGLSDFYPAKCTIQYYDEDNLDDWGEPDPVWANLEGHIDIPCSIGPSGGQEVKQPDKTYVVSSHHISLKGSFPDITEAMRAVVAGQKYDILLVENDSHGETTRLTVQVVSM